MPLIAGKLSRLQNLTSSNKHNRKNRDNSGFGHTGHGSGERPFATAGVGHGLSNAELVHKCSVLGAVITIIGCLLCLPPVMSVLIRGNGEWIKLPWSMPFGSFTIAIDQLTTVFMLPILIVSALAAVYGVGYLSSHGAGSHGGVGGGEDSEDSEGSDSSSYVRKVANSWLFFNLLVGSMLLVVTARNGILFLLAWELMALASFALVLFENRQKASRKAAWTYLVATHIGTAFILVLFALLGQYGNGSLDFDGFAQVASRMAGVGAGAGAGADGVSPQGGSTFLGLAFPSVLFLLAVIGFGTKAGIIPLHVWLPEAHPAAPSHVSALMSGVMIKTGIYGIVRTLTFLGEPPVWWGWLLLIAGMASALLGILMALAQSDIKRMLAYSSVENMGIITMGLGVGLLGVGYHLPVVAAAGFVGAFFHILNHSLFKSLLFFGAGSVVSLTGTRNMEKLGGLIKVAPVTGFLFLGGCLAICGLPPLNGFIGEFPIYLGAMNLVTTSGLFGGLGSYEILPAVAGIAVIVVLALVGGLAAACFTRAFGIVFQGEPRSSVVARGRLKGDSPTSMLVPMGGLALLCVLVAAVSPLVATGYLAPAARQVVVGAPTAAAAAAAVAAVPGDLTASVFPAASLSAAHAATAVGTGTATSTISGTFSTSLVEILLPLKAVSILFAILLLLGTILLFVRRRIGSGRDVGAAPTWGCGYLRPTGRMQYTSSSFTAPLLGTFRAFLRTRRLFSSPQGYFPAKNGRLTSHTPDFFRDTVFTRLFLFIEGILARLRWLQHGRLHFYILYIFIALVILFVWKLR